MLYIKTVQKIITKLTGKHLLLIKLKFYSFQPDSKEDCDTWEIGKKFRVTFLQNIS